MALKESLKHLLDERRIATLATNSPDGLPHITAVWYLYDDGALYVATNAKAGKGRNLASDSRAALCIESREAGKECGISACGEVELLEGADARPWARRVNEKYLTEAALAHPVVGPAFTDMSDLVIKLQPTRWICWDMETLGEELFGAGADESEFFYPTLP
jgi:PPOX class probable F420-dependent enzyme